MEKSRPTNILDTLDWITLGIYVFLVIIGWFNIYAASYDFDQQPSFFDLSHRAGKQFVWILTAFVLIGIIMSLDIRLYDYFGYLIYALVLLLLIATIFLAKDVKGSRSWLQLGPIAFQPAELAKIATAIALAKMMSPIRFEINSWRSLFKPVMLLFFPFAMIILQKETGSALVFASFFLMFYREGMNGLVLVLGLLIAVLFVISIGFSTFSIQYYNGSWGIVLAVFLILIVQFVFSFLYSKEIKQALWLLAIAVVTGAFSYLLNIFVLVNYEYVALGFGLFSVIYWWIVSIQKRIKQYLLIVWITLGSVLFCFSANYMFNEVLKPHQQERIKVLLGMKEDLRGAGYNVHQSKIAIGSGGLLGKGYLNGTQTKLKYVPEQDTDFIFCTVGEEWGFVGSSFILLVYLALLLRIIHIAERQPDGFARIYGYSIAGIFFFHLFVNVGMIIGLMPVIGIPLPFLSYGGSSLWSFTAMLFILLRLDASRFRYRGEIY